MLNGNGSAHQIAMVPRGNRLSLRLRECLRSVYGTRSEGYCEAETVGRHLQSYMYKYSTDELETCKSAQTPEEYIATCRATLNHNDIRRGIMVASTVRRPYNLPMADAPYYSNNTHLRTCRPSAEEKTRIFAKRWREL